MISPECEPPISLGDTVNIAACGGKAVGLAQARAFVAVPDFVVIPESWFRAAASMQLELVAAEWAGWDSASARSRGAARLLATVDLAPAMREALSAAVHEHLPGAVRLAVRSSALDEDGQHASRAGLYTSVLNVSPCALNRAVTECWRSWFSTRALAHRAHAGWRPPRMAVVIQRMVDAHYAGIAAVYRNMVEVESIAGLAAGLVDGTAEPDHHGFTLPLQTPRLPQEHAAHTASHLCRQFGGGDLELEWAWDGTQIQVIQARPLTVAPPAPRFFIGSSQRPVLLVSPLYGQTPPEREFPLGQLDGVIDHYRRKRRRLYAVATDYGCSLSSALVLRFNHSGTTGDAWASVENQLGETALLDISPTERQRIIPTPDLGVTLRDLCGDDPSALLTVVVREFITGLGGALSSVLADGGVRIEYSREGLLAINRGLADTHELTVYEDQVAEAQLIPTGWTSQMLSTIADVTRLFAAQYGPSVVEWSLRGDLAIPVDYSRSGNVENIAAKGAVISEGACEGPALLVDSDGVAELIKESEGTNRIGGRSATIADRRIRFSARPTDQHIFASAGRDRRPALRHLGDLDSARGRLCVLPRSFPFLPSRHSASGTSRSCSDYTDESDAIQRRHRPRELERIYQDRRDIVTGSFAPRIALVGLSGTEKSTLAAALMQALCRDGYTAKVVKLSAPLYRLQDAFYAEAGVMVAEARQDQQLMVDMARYLRRISDRALLDRFLQTLAEMPPDTAVINDDLREPTPDAHGLREAGFTIIRLECPEEVRLARLVERGDLSTIDERAVWGAALERIPVDLTLSTITSDVAATAEIALAGILATHHAAARQPKR